MSNSVPLGQLTVTQGPTATQRFERLASKAWLTRKISVLLPVGGLTQEDKARLAASLQLQRHSFVLEDVSLEALGDPAFVTAVGKWQVAAISQGDRGLDAGDVLALLPSARLVAALQEPSYQRLGLEEPMPGSKQLEQKYLHGQHHVFVDLPISKTRAKQAAKAGEVATSRWQALVEPLKERISMLAYCDKEPDMPYDFLPLQSSSATIRQQEVPLQVRYLNIQGSARGVPPLPQLVTQPTRWSGQGKADLSEAYGAACEDLLDWLGALELNLERRLDGELWQVSEPEQEESVGSEEVLLWTMGESLMGPRQISHALKICQDALQSQAAAWFILSIWGAEDAPISHHGGAHGFDITGAHHAHLISIRNGDNLPSLLIEEANSLHSNAT